MDNIQLLSSFRVISCPLLRIVCGLYPSAGLVSVSKFWVVAEEEKNTWESLQFSFFFFFFFFF